MDVRSPRRLTLICDPEWTAIDARADSRAGTDAVKSNTAKPLWMTTADELATFVQQVGAVMDGIQALAAGPSVTLRVDVPPVER